MFTLIIHSFAYILNIIFLFACLYYLYKKDIGLANYYLIAASYLLIQSQI